MNQLAQTYWDTYWGNNKTRICYSLAIWDAPNYLAQLVIDGIKTATCSGHIFMN